MFGLKMFVSKKGKNVSKLNGPNGKFDLYDSRNLNFLRRLLKQVNANVNAIAEKQGVKPEAKLFGIDEEDELNGDDARLGDLRLGSLDVAPVTNAFNAGQKDFNNLLDDMHESMKQYFAGLLNPEYAYQKGLQIKIPNPLPIPSVTLTQISSFHINRLPEGKFWICWNPNFGCTKRGITKFLFGDPQGNQFPATSASSVAYGVNDREVIFHEDALPDAEVSRIRLVSAKMKVTYRGSAENLSGKFYSCATFQPMPCSILRNNDPQVAKGRFHFYSDDLGAWYTPTPNDMISFAKTGYRSDENYTYELTSQAVQNGLWARSVTLSDFNRGISCTYIPMDPECLTFNAPGTVRGSTLKKFIPANHQQAQIENHLAMDRSGAPLIDSYGGKMGYYVVGEGLPTNEAAAIDVEFFYNWELLPTVSSASTMRNFNSGYMPSSKMYEDMMGSLSLSDATVRLVTAGNIGKLEGWETVGNWFKRIGSGIKKVADAMF